MASKAKCRMDMNRLFRWIGTLFGRRRRVELGYEYAFGFAWRTWTDLTAEEARKMTPEQIVERIYVDSNPIHPDDVPKEGGKE